MIEMMMSGQKKLADVYAYFGSYSSTGKIRAIKFDSEGGKLWDRNIDVGDGFFGNYSAKEQALCAVEGIIYICSNQGDVIRLTGESGAWGIMPSDGSRNVVFDVNANHSIYLANQSGVRISNFNATSKKIIISNSQAEALTPNAIRGLPDDGFVVAYDTSTDNRGVARFDSSGALIWDFLRIKSARDYYSIRGLAIVGGRVAFIDAYSVYWVDLDNGRLTGSDVRQDGLLTSISTDRENAVTTVDGYSKHKARLYENEKNVASLNVPVQGSLRGANIVDGKFYYCTQSEMVILEQVGTNSTKSFFLLEGLTPPGVSSQYAQSLGLHVTLE